MSTLDAPTRAALERIRHSQTTIHAFEHVADETILETARHFHEPLAPLGGMSVGVKDIIDTADMPTEYGSKLYSGHRPVRDAAVVSMLRRAGASIIGKTVTSEFATWMPTRALNPRHPDHTPGGSSAGSAAAVAAGLVPVALGTQSLGSIIRPASFCGVVGFKPTFRRLPISGVKVLAESLDTVGLLGQRVLEVKRVYHSLVPGLDASRHKARLLFSRGPHWHLASQDARDSIVSVIDHLRGVGVSISEMDAMPGMAEVTSAAQRVHDFEFRRSLLPELLSAPGRLAPGLEEALRCDALQPDDHRRALGVIEAQRSPLSKLWHEYDAILCLATLGEAPRDLNTTGDSVMNRAWTALHVPCITLPVLRGANGLPIGLQIVCDRYEDDLLLSIAERLEAILSQSPSCGNG